MIGPDLDAPIPGAAIDEWLFVAWTPDGSAGVISGHRLTGRRAWYWSAHVRVGFPLLHLAEWDVKLRRDPMVVKAPEMWAEHTCDDPLRQWSIGNEAYFAELERPDDALGRAYGIPTPTAFDLEWYATAEATTESCSSVESTDADLVSFTQEGVVHGLVEVVSRSNLVLEEVPAFRWRRATRRHRLDPPTLDEVRAHTGLRAPFRFPDGAVADWVVGSTGWREVAPHGGAQASQPAEAPPIDSPNGASSWEVPVR